MSDQRERPSDMREVSIDSETLGKENYWPPAVEPLGTVVEATGGPQGGTIDTLFGGTGGFQSPVPPPIS